MLAIPVTTIV